MIYKVSTDAIAQYYQSTHINDSVFLIAVVEYFSFLLLGPTQFTLNTLQLLTCSVTSNGKKIKYNYTNANYLLNQLQKFYKLINIYNNLFVSKYLSSRATQK